MQKNSIWTLHLTWPGWLILSILTYCYWTLKSRIIKRTVCSITAEDILKAPYFSWFILQIPLTGQSHLDHNLSRYDGLETRQTSKPQDRRPLFDVELYLTVHKSFVSTSLSIIHRGCTFHLRYPIGPLLNYTNSMSSITATLHKLTQTQTKTQNKHFCLVSRPASYLDILC
jgi:hypothetical protein